MYDIPTLILTTLAVLLVLTFHEFSHAFTAYKLGDGTAKACGRLTVNPLKHLDPVGAVCLIFLHVGWAKPVPINARNFKKPKRDFALVALAGPLTNLVLAFVSAFFALLLCAIFKGVDISEFGHRVVQTAVDFTVIFHTVNIGIALFNLIPIPPLDGSRILTVFLKPKAYFAFMKHERKIYYIFLGWLIIGGILSNALLSIPYIASNPVLSTIAEFISLSRILGHLIGLLSSLMLDFWQLIPFLKL